MEAPKSSWITKLISGYWKFIIELGVDKVPDAYKERVRRSNQQTLTYFLLGHPYTLVYLALGATKLAALNIGLSITTPTIMGLNFTGRHRAARIVQSLSFAVSIAIVNTAIGLQSGIELLFFPALVSIFVNFEYEERRDLSVALIVALGLIFGSEAWAHEFEPWIGVPLHWFTYIRLGTLVASFFIFISQIALFFNSIRRSQEQLKLSHAHTRAILESVDDGFYYVDKNWTLLYVNPKAQVYLEQNGVKNPEGRNFWTLLSSENKREYVPKLKAAMASGSVYREEYFDDAQEKWCEISAFPSETGMSITFRIIHARKQSEIALQESEQLQRAIFDQAATGLNILSPDGIYLRANAEMCRFLGREESEILGRKTSDFTAPEDMARSLSDVVALKSGAINTLTKQKRYIHKSGRSLPANLQVRVVLDELGAPKYYVTSVQDLTEAKLAEQKLVQSSKMSSLGEMAGSIAHEINSPMAVIQLSAEQIEDPEMLSLLSHEDISVIGKRITETVQRISKIIRGLKSFSRNAEQDAMEPTRVSNIVSDVLELCRERFKTRNTELRIKDLPDVEILCRPSEISQVLLNLLNNALDAVEPQSAGNRWVEISGHFRFSTLSLSVKDSGSRIPDAVADRILEPFFTTKPAGKGTGLGLSISKGIMENHGGNLSLDRSSAQTCFVVDLKATNISSLAGAQTPRAVRNVANG